MLNFLKNLFTKVPDNVKFKPKQKVFCMRTHEVVRSEVCNGYVIGYAFKKKSYWAFSDIPSNWYKVRYENGRKVYLPEERLYDLEDYISKTTQFLHAPHVVNEKSEAKDKIISQIINAERYLGIGYPFTFSSKP